MNEEKFLKFKIIKRFGDDGLPRDILQIDIEKQVLSDETVGGFVHEQRLFVDVLPLRELLNQK